MLGHIFDSTAWIRVCAVKRRSDCNYSLFLFNNTVSPRAVKGVESTNTYDEYSRKTNLKINKMNSYTHGKNSDLHISYRQKVYRVNVTLQQVFDV